MCVQVLVKRFILRLLLLDGLYKEASYKPYAVAAMIFLQKVKDPVATLAALEAAAKPRWNQA